MTSWLVDQTSYSLTNIFYFSLNWYPLLLCKLGHDFDKLQMRFVLLLTDFSVNMWKRWQEFHRKMWKSESRTHPAISMLLNRWYHKTQLQWEAEFHCRCSQDSTVCCCKNKCLEKSFIKRKKILNCYLFQGHGGEGVEDWRWKVAIGGVHPEQVALRFLISWKLTLFKIKSVILRAAKCL